LPDPVQAVGTASTLFFVSNDGVRGPELWALRLAAGRASVEVSGDGSYPFAGTGLTVAVGGVGRPGEGAGGVGRGTHTVTAEHFRQAPAGRDGIAEPGVGPWRWVVRAEEGFSFTTAEVRVRLADLVGASFPDPTHVVAYRRSTPGAGAFTALPTSYDAASGEVVATGATALGEFVLASSDPVANEPGAEAPSVFALSPARPNPFGDATAVTLTTTEAQPVRVEAFDALGRRVAVLHDGVLTAGPHTLRFDAAGLPDGVYLVRARGAHATALQRVTRLR